MKNFKLFILLFLLISIKANCQLTDHPRGMYVDRFFSFSGDEEPGHHTAADVDQNITLLGNEAKENELLQYAKDHHITYLLLYDVHKFIYDLDMPYNGSTLGALFCNFISKAKNQYCIQKVGVAGSAKTFFDDLKPNLQTVPLQLTQLERTILNGNPLIHVQDSNFSSDNERKITEFLKMFLKIANFNRSNAARFGVASGGINCSNSTIDVITSEIEFWNTNEGPVPSNWENYRVVINGMDGIKDITSGLYVETYLGILENHSTTNYSGPNPSLSDPLFVARSIDSVEVSGGGRKVDRIMNHYYLSSDQDVLNVYNTADNRFKQLYHDQRFVEFLDPSTINTSVIQPIFSVENSFYNHNDAEKFLGNWFSQSKRNNIWTYEKEFYDDWIRDRGSNVHDPINGNDVAPGAVTWFSSPFLMMQKEFQNPFISNSPVCSGSTVDFQYQGPIEDGLSYHFFILNSTGGIEFSEIKNWPPYEPIYVASSDIYDYPIHLPTGIILAAGQYTAHLILNYTSDCSKEFVQPVIVSPDLKLDQSKMEVCGRTLVHTASGESIMFTATPIPGATYQWTVNAILQSSSVNEMSYFPLINTTTTDRTDHISCIVSGASTCLTSSPQTINTTVIVHPNFDSQIYLSCIAGSGIRLYVTNPGNSPTYLWSDGSTLATLAPTVPGLYSVITTQGVGGCTASMKKRITITHLNTPVISPQTVGFCNGVPVPVDFTVKNPQDGVRYQWFLNSSTTAAMTGSAYTFTPSDGETITVTATYGGCTHNSTVVTVDFSKLTLALTSYDERCNGENIGSITATASNGSTPAYEYKFNIQPFDPLNLSTALAAGTYTVQAKNGACLSDIQSITITEPALLTATLSTTVPIKCHADIATLKPNVIGGIPPYYYVWSDNDNLPVIKRDAINYPSNIYNVTITDGHTCTTTTNSLTLIDPPELHSFFTHSDVSTCGGSDGYACFDVSAGTLPYTFSWSCSALNTTCLYNLAATANCVGTVIDGAGCEVTKNFSIENLQSLEVSTATNVASCGNASGSATATAFGGNTYSYSWTPSGGSNESAIGLSAGVYTVSVTANNGCTGTAIATVLAGSCCNVAGIPTPSNIYPTLTGTYDLHQSIVLSQDLTMDLCHLYISEGLSITVPSGFTLDIKNSHLEACSNMWKGIIVENGGTLVIENSLIEDAENAAFIKDGASLTSFGGTIFNDNYIGISTATNPLDRMNEYPAFVVENTSFSGSGLLLGQYPGQGTTPGNYPFAGLAIYSSTVAIGGSSGNNTFNHLNAGILSRYSNIDVHASDFKNIQADPAYDYFTFGGCGIDARSTRGRFSLTQIGNGIGINSFENCKYGIYTHRMNTDVSLNKMVNVGTGIRIEDCYFGEIQVLTNKIDCNEFGVDLRMNDGCQKMWIKFNQIDVGSLQAPTSLMGGVGINVMEFGIGGLNRYISNNVPINVNTYGLSGIREIAVTNMNTSGNHINLNNVAVNLNGIDNEGGKLDTILCNHVIGNNTTSYIGPQQSGYFTCMSNNLEMKCNESDKLFNGFYFSGPCTNTNYSGNEINAHQYGLYLDAAAIIGQQDYTGNQWLLSYGLKGAYNQNAVNNGTGALVAFRVDPNDGVNQLPLTYQPSDWFNPIVNGGVTFDCSTNNTCGIYPLINSEEISAMDLSIARDEISTSQYEFETKWKLKQDLYNKLRENPWLIYSDPDLTTFYNELFNTVITDLENVNQLKKSLFNVISTLKNTLDQNAFTIKSNLESIKMMQSQLIEKGLTSSQKDLIKSSILNFQVNIKILDESSHQIYSNLENEKYSNAEFLNNLNDQILSPKTIEVNEKEVNAIYTNAVVKNNTHFTETEISHLFAIAAQCAISGGPAVFKARSLYSMIDDNVSFNDKDLCFNQGIILRHRNTTEENSNPIIFPNPSTGKFTLKYDFKNSVDVYLKIFDGLQREMKIYKLESNNSQMEIDLSEYNNGLYIYKIQSSDNNVHAQGKLSLIK